MPRRSAITTPAAGFWKRSWGFRLRKRPSASTGKFARRLQSVKQMVPGSDIDATFAAILGYIAIGPLFFVNRRFPGRLGLRSDR
ncbi:hypothetical protein DESC_740004 [Desulfosarcina cetonica]|nr:hypothetical protein DESC_740004 [Desulfosarcina cetonica]